MKRILETSCNLCGHSPLDLYLSLNRGKQILICASCTNAITYPEPTAYYDDHSFYSHVQNDGARWRSYSQQIALFLENSLSQRGRLLDVGCSHGLLIEEAEHIGFQAEGVEPSKSAVEYCRKRGLRVRHGYLEEGLFPPQSFDVIVASHVIEHVANPCKLLDTIYRLLKPAGSLCLCQTNYQGTLPGWFGKYWEYWVPKEHYYHFSLKGIQYVLDRCRFQIVKSQILALGYYVDLKPRGVRSLASMAVRNVSLVASRWKIGFPFQGDQMYILAQPRGCGKAASGVIAHTD